jgi:nucleotide-binding universal stress UspA family protein
MKILLATDASEYSEAAVEALLEHRWPKDAQLRVLSVAHTPVPVDAHPGVEANYHAIWAESTAKKAQDTVNRTADRIRAAGLTVEPLIRHGNPGSEIVKEAEQWSADLILVGSHGRTGITRWLLGSVAEQVVRHAPCSVEVVRKRAR